MLTYRVLRYIYDSLGRVLSMGNAGSITVVLLLLCGVGALGYVKVSHYTCMHRMVIYTEIDI